VSLIGRIFFEEDMDEETTDFEGAVEETRSSKLNFDSTEYLQLCYLKSLIELSKPLVIGSTSSEDVVTLKINFLNFKMI
jgi:hypothetical protein